MSSLLMVLRSQLKGIVRHRYVTGVVLLTTKFAPPREQFVFFKNPSTLNGSLYVAIGVSIAAHISVMA